MDPDRPTRRRSPGWVRALDQRQLHGLAFKLRRLASTEGLSDRQEWLWDACVSELEYRWRRDVGSVWLCACELCIPPFPDGE